jgi:hypothetical protein
MLLELVTPVKIFGFRAELLSSKEFSVSVGEKQENEVDLKKRPVQVG